MVWEPKVLLSSSLLKSSFDLQQVSHSGGCSDLPLLGGLCCSSRCQVAESSTVGVLLTCPELLVTQAVVLLEGQSLFTRSSSRPLMMWSMQFQSLGGTRWWFFPHDLTVRTTYYKEDNAAPEIVRDVFKTKLSLKYSMIEVTFLGWWMESSQIRCHLLITVFLLRDWGYASLRSWMGL